MLNEKIEPTRGKADLDLFSVESGLVLTDAELLQIHGGNCGGDGGSGGAGGSGGGGGRGGSGGAGGGSSLPPEIIDIVKQPTPLPVTPPPATPQK